jgi:hypothetical protein
LKLSRNPDKSLNVIYTASEGFFELLPRHSFKFSIRFNGTHIAGSPFKVKTASTSMSDEEDSDGEEVPGISLFD